MKNCTLRRVMAFSLVSLLALSSALAQGPGYIIRQAGTTNLGSGGTTGAFPSAATVTGREILNPDYAGGTAQTNYATVSPYSGVWTATEDIIGSEIPFVAIPPFPSEVPGDLRRGPSHLFSDFVPGGRSSDMGASYYMYYKSTVGKEALCFRMRLGSVMPGAKAYSISIDTDGKFGASGANPDPNYQPETSGTNGNPGFELEVVLTTQNAGKTGIALYNVDGTSSPVLVWSANDYTQFSQLAIAGTNDNGDPDFYLDFFIPWNKITGVASLGVTTSTPLRFVPTTVMAPQPATGGPKSDIYGSNDNNYRSANREYEDVIAGTSGFSMTQLSSTPAGSVPGTNNTQPCTAAPTITSVTTTGGANNKGVVTGQWTKLPVSSLTSADIYVSLNGTPMAGKTTATSGGTWTYDIPAGVTLAAGNKITAQAQATGENMCQTSNSVTVSACTNAAWTAANLVAPIGDNSGGNYNCFVGSAPTTTKGVGATNRNSSTWTVYINEAFGNITKNSASNAGTAAFSNGGASTFTPATTPNWYYSDGCQGGSNMGAGIYTFWYQDANGCKSEITPLCVTGTGNASSQVGGTVNVVPVVSPANITPYTTSVTVTGAAGSTISLYFDGEVVASGNIAGTYNSATPTSGTITFTGLSFQQNGVVSATSKVVTGAINTSFCVAKSTAQVVGPCVTQAPRLVVSSSTGYLTIGSPITGVAEPGASIKVYNAANTLLATTTADAVGFWTTAGATLSNGFTGNAVASTTYYATAKGACTLSANSANASTGSAVTSARCGSITTTGITMATTAISGVLTGTAAAGTVVYLYEDGNLIGSATTATNSWGPIDVTDKLYSGNGTSNGILTIGVQESGKEEIGCPASVPVTCTGPLTPTYTQQSSNGTSGPGATVPSGGTMTYTITNLSPNTFYSIADASTGRPYASGLWTSSSATPGNSIMITTDPLTASGTYNGMVKATSVTAVEMCSALAAATSFNVLPVTLLQWKGEHNGSANLLSWKTATERGTDYFVIEKSVDGAVFQPIGRAVAKGSNSHYAFTDNNLASAINYYRLRMVDRDGKAAFSQTIVLKNNGGSMVLATVRPNPFVSEVALSLSLNEAQAISLTLLDAAGRSVATKQFAGTQGLNTVRLTGLAPLPKGIYVLRITGDDIVLQEKLVKVN